MLDDNRMGKKLIHELSEQGDIESLKQLLTENPCLVHENGWFGMKPLHYAAQGGSVECVRLLIDKGADVNAKCVVNKSTAIFKASTGEIAKLLVENGAILNFVTTRGRTTLDYAIQGLHLDVVRYLVSQEVDVNYTEKVDFNHTMTQWALTEARNEEDKAKAYQILEILLEAGADTNIQNIYDNTVLHEASRCGLTEIVKLLLRYDADPCIRDVSNYSCFDYAENFPEILELFEPYKQNLKPVIKTQDTPEQLIARLRKIPKFKCCHFKSCTEAEIEDLERRNRVQLPESYKKFLQIMGKGAGNFLIDDHWAAFYEDFDDWLGVDYFKIPEEEYHECSQEEIKLSLNFPDNFFVFADRNGCYPLGFFADGVDEEPKIYTVDEYEIKLHGESFWEFFQDMIEYYEFFNDPNRFSRNKSQVKENESKKDEFE